MGTARKAAMAMATTTAEGKPRLDPLERREAAAIPARSL
jgi:hypothetical protein